LNEVMVALLRVFIAHGDRTNRKKARFKYVVEALGLDGVLVEVEKRLPFTLARLAPDASGLRARTFSQQGHSHVGTHPQKQPGLFSLGASVPVGQLTAPVFDPYSRQPGYKQRAVRVGLVDSATA
jgi:ferredoxin-nitrite reductase